MTSLPTTFLFHPTFLSEGDEITFLSENVEGSVTTTVASKTVDGAVIEPVVFTVPGEYMVEIAFNEYNRTYIAPFTVTVKDSAVVIDHFHNVNTFSMQSAIPMHFSGVFNLVPVMVKFVNGTESCDSEAIEGTELSLYEEGQETAFFFPAAEDEYHFCVKHGEEAWEEEEAFTLSFLTVEPHRLLADVDGTVTYPLAGTGMRNGDLIRWTWTTEGNACSRAAATSVVEDGKTVFTLPTGHQYNYLYMCYNMQNSSEFVLFPENYVDIRGGFDITPAVAFVGMQTELTVDVRNWNATDLIKFVPVAQSCESESEGMNLEFSEETLNKISVTFQEAGEFKLCYLYSDLEEYLEAAQYTMTVRSLDVQSSVTLLAGVK